MNFYPTLYKTVQSMVSVQHIGNNLHTAVLQLEDNIIKYADDCKIIFEIGNPHMFYHNSFLPLVEVNLHETHLGTKVDVWVKLKVPVRIFLTIYMAVAIVFQLGFLTLYFREQLASPLLCLLPIGLIAFAYLLSYIGLWCSSRNVIISLIKSIKKTERT